MSVISMVSRFPNQKACIDRLEECRWPMQQAFCPFCESERVARKTENELVGRWNCHNCTSSFNVLSGTIFQGTHIPLQKWFLAIYLMVNAKKSVSSCQLARDLELNQKTAWRMQQQIRAAMASDDGELLQGLVEADETYVGGKPRYKNKNNKRGRGSKNKTAVIGVVSRRGNVKAQVSQNTKGRTLLGFLKRSVNTEQATLITDEFKGYLNAKRLMTHIVVDHSKGYVDPEVWGIHTNTIEGVWALLKRAWYGTHHHYSRRWMPLFVAEACWKYNHRNKDDAFGSFLKGCFA